MESQLDIIKEKLNNIEASSNRSSIRKTLDDAIKTMAIRESRTRQLTVTIRTDELMKGDQLMQQINENFRVTLPTQNWEDKKHLYLRFSHSGDIDKFARDVTKSNNEPLTSIGKRIDRDSKGSIVTLTRKPIKMEITNVKDHVKLDDIKKAFEKLDTGIAEITELKEGKLVERTKSRYVSFKANAEAFSLIYKNLDGIITTTRTRLYPKVNAKPFCAETVSAYQLCTNAKEKPATTVAATNTKATNVRKRPDSATIAKCPDIGPRIATAENTSKKQLKNFRRQTYQLNSLLTRFTELF